MCGIAGFSLSPSSTINARHLAHHLLASIELRGTDASGFAYADPMGSGIFKDSVPGGQLSLGLLPRKAGTVVLHTRMATQGTPSDNSNNHPLPGPDGHVALVHNGVISNDMELRAVMEYDLAQVDSAVIPVLVERSGMDEVGMLAGYGAVAWVDTREPGVLSLARIDSSPVAYTTLLDGSFVFASTADLLEYALVSAGVYDYGAIFEMNEQNVLKIESGFIRSLDKTPAMRYDSYGYRWQSVTSGASKVDWGGERVGSSFGEIEPAAKFDFDSDLNEWRSSRGMVFDDAAPDSSGDNAFYLIDEDMNVLTFSSLTEMDDSLGWLAGLSRTDYDPFQSANGKVNWVNHVTDIGHIWDGEFVSWIEDIGAMDDVSARDHGTLREGTAMLATMKGA